MNTTLPWAIEFRKLYGKVMRNNKSPEDALHEFFVYCIEQEEALAKK